MNELTKFLIKELLDESKTVALYGGGFKPPTKGHFNVVELALNKLPDIDELKVLVGQGVRDGITQEESLAVWNIYKNYLSPKVIIEPSIAPVKSVLNYAKDNPDTKVYWILGARDGEEGDLEDIARRTKTINKYPNLIVKVITNSGGVSGTKARNAIKLGNKEQFFHLIPDIKEKEQIWNIVHPVVKEEKVTEVGEANLKPYKWKEVDRESYFVYTRFVTDSKTQYDVDLKSTNYVDDDLNNLRALGIEFSAKLKGDAGASAKIVVNKGELYRVMATITNIIKYYAKKFKVKAISYSPSKKSDEEDFGSQRDNLYRAFISKAIPGVRFEKNSNFITAILPDKTLNEGKQVGILYHYTSADGLKGILSSNSIKASEEIYMGQNLYYVSFTRNKNFYKKGSKFGVKTEYRITLDGDKLSNKYKIIPHAYKPGYDYTENWEYDWLEDEPENVVRDFFDATGEYDEQEERISFKGPEGSIDNIKNYIFSVDKVEDLQEGHPKKKDPEKGTGKKPKGSSRRLYTDEDPKDTVSIKFKTKEDIVDTLNKTSFKAKSHARQSQIINVVHQRVRAAYSKAKDPEVKSRLKRALDYIEKRKEMSKKKTERLNKMKEASDPQAGTALPYGSGFAPVKELVTSTEVICDNCGWEWSITDGGKDLYVCHKCEHDNTPNKLNEGRYDSITRLVVKDIMNSWKSQFNGKAGELRFEEDYELDNSKGQPIDFELLAVLKLEETEDETYIVDGGANEELDPPYLEVTFQVDPRNLPKMWSTIYNDLIDVVRHEIEHLTQTGVNVISSKEMADDQSIRQMINWGLLPQVEYFKLEKEVDAMLQGMYLKAKKSRTPFKDVINDYFEKVGLEGEDKQDVLNLWTKRLKTLNLPAIQETDMFGLNELAKTFVKETFEKTWNLQEGMLSLSKYMIDNGMNITPLPKIKVIKDDEENASHLLGKTAYYDPNNKSITLYTMNRHPKDVLRSFAHEMVHHEQNLEGRLNNINTTNTNEGGNLPEIEKEAYEKGNMMLRNWEDSIKNV